MSEIICIENLHKYYDKTAVLNNITFSAQTGEIIGVVGTNGAGKTTLLKSLLGLTKAKGQLTVCGLDPYKQQTELMKQVSFIADTAILPKWLTANKLLAYMDKMHPNFSIEAAKNFLSTTNIHGNTKISKLSKGMVTQLHLALVIAIQSTLLVLDEPTLGLDIIRRKEFYQQMLEHYFDDNSTIIITTHQIEEIEHILTRVIFIEGGEILADIQVDELSTRYSQLSMASNLPLEEAQMIKKSILALNPLYQQKTLTGEQFIFDGVNHDKLAQLGTLTTPSLSDLFVALANTKTQENHYA